MATDIGWGKHKDNLSIIRSRRFFNRAGLYHANRVSKPKRKGESLSLIDDSNWEEPDLTPDPLSYQICAGDCG